MAKKAKKQITQLDAIKSIRKPMPPSKQVHSTKKGKRGYDRKESKRIERDW